MIIDENKEEITYAFDFLKTTISKTNEGIDEMERKFFESEQAEYYTVFNVQLNTKNKEEIHEYFEKHYMDKVRFPSYSNCLKELILDFLDIPDEFEINSYKSIAGGKTSSIRVNTKEGAVYLFKNLLLDYGETNKDGLYTIFRNVKEYYNRDENKERKPSFVKVINDTNN
ncbi:hypothetical protein [Konateibacter massiliensis]|uniref:hypothetical protein n=1 Tax=Konateibacter massiliensis TaxID=2002841 RepID=UPI000C15BD9C|nr:hypothetical protein [Konateibacter massiliensis]